MWVVSGKGSVMANEVTSHSHMSVCWINRIPMRTSAEYSSTNSFADRWEQSFFFFQLPSIQFSYRCQSSLVYISILLPVIFLDWTTPSLVLFTIFRVRNWRACVLTFELVVLGGSTIAWVYLKGAASCLPFLRQYKSTCGKLMDGREVLNTTYPDLFNGLVFILKLCCQMAIDCSLPPHEVIMHVWIVPSGIAFSFMEHDHCMTHSDSSNPENSEDTTRGICLPSQSVLHTFSWDSFKPCNSFSLDLQIG